MRNLPRCTLSAITLMALLLTSPISKAESFKTVSDSSCPSGLATPVNDDSDGFGVMSVAFSRDGKLILAGGASHTAFVWDGQTGALLHCFVGHTFAANYVAF